MFIDSGTGPYLRQGKEVELMEDDLLWSLLALALPLYLDFPSTLRTFSACGGLWYPLLYLHPSVHSQCGLYHSSQLSRKSSTSKLTVSFQDSTWSHYHL